METPIQKKRKLIDIPVDAFKVLTIAALDENISLKGYLEQLVKEKADSLKDKVKM
ncbi:MAG: hypothetical protein PEPC_01668 [Peptostreptococcus russellii]